MVAVNHICQHILIAHLRAAFDKFFETPSRTGLGRSVDKNLELCIRKDNSADVAFQQPNIQASGCTALGEALALLAQKADQEVTKTTAEQKGDWKPLVFIMTDGEPTDDLNKGLAEFKKRKWGMVVACAAGAGANTDTLKKITECVVSLDTADSATIKAFFKWVSASVSSGSMKVEETGAEATTLSELPPPPPEVNIVV